MNHSLRGLRGLLGITIAWSIAWIPLGVCLAMVEGFRYGRGFAFPNIVREAPTLATVGAVCGFGFAIVLAAMERRRTLAGLTFPRVVAWGVAGSVVIPTLAILTGGAGSTIAGGLWSLAIFAIPGGICSAATFALARRAEPSLGDSDERHALGEPLDLDAARPHVAVEERR